MSKTAIHPENPRAVEWSLSEGEVPYGVAVSAMETRVAQIAEGTAAEHVWLLEHPPLYTAGTSARAADLIDPQRLPVHTTGRGGQYTYHGPGQRVAYVMLNIKERGGDVRAFVVSLEGWLIDTLAHFGVEGLIKPGRVGVWIERRDPTGQLVEEKIAAIGIRVRRGVTYHGVSLNVAPDLTHYQGIIPCGLAELGVTSLAALGRATEFTVVDSTLRRCFERRFGQTYS